MLIVTVLFFISKMPKSRNVAVVVAYCVCNREKVSLNSQSLEWVLP